MGTSRKPSGSPAVALELRPLKAHNPHTADVFRILVAALLVTAAVRAQNPTPTAIPNGLPEWAYNLPDKVQPPEAKVPATVRAAGSSREYEACGDCLPRQPSRLVSRRASPRAAQRERPDAERVRVVPPDVGPGSPGVRRHRGHAGRIHRPADEVLQERRAERGRAHGADRPRRLRRGRERGGGVFRRAEKPAPFVKVIETATPPKTYISADARHRRIDPDGGTEPIRRRIVQVPEDPMRTTIRDPHAGFVAYVPPGSVAAGAALAKTGAAGRTIQCALCHGDALTGLGEAPVSRACSRSTSRGSSSRCRTARAPAPTRR